MSFLIGHYKNLKPLENFRFVWEQQSVNDIKQFIIFVKVQGYTQTCFSEIEESSRYRLYRNIKKVHDTLTLIKTTIQL